MRSKLKVVVLVALLFGAPALVTTALLTTDFGSAVADGKQPGGAVRGVIEDADGRGLAGMEVELASVNAAGQRSGGPRATTSADGAFELRAQPIEGHYEIRAGGGDWQWTAQPFSFVDSNGKSIEAKPVHVVLHSGCRLELEFAHGHENTSVEGDYTLQGEFGDGFFFGLVKPQMKTSGKIKDGRLVLTGLPPMKVDVFVRLATGETVELRLELATGMNKKRIQI